MTSVTTPGYLELLSPFPQIYGLLAELDLDGDPPELEEGFQIVWQLQRFWSEYRSLTIRQKDIIKTAIDIFNSALIQDKHSVGYEAGVLVASKLILEKVSPRLGQCLRHFQEVVLMVQLKVRDLKAA